MSEWVELVQTLGLVAGPLAGVYLQQRAGRRADRESRLYADRSYWREIRVGHFAELIEVGHQLALARAVANTDRYSDEFVEELDERFSGLTARARVLAGDTAVRAATAAFYTGVVSVEAGEEGESESESKAKLELFLEQRAALEEALDRSLGIS